MGFDPCNPCEGCIPGNIPNETFKQSLLVAVCEVLSAVEAGGGGGGGVIPSALEGRLTLTAGVPVTTANVTGASTIYFTPYRGNKISLYSGTAWESFSLTEISLALSGLTAGKNYDVFVYSNAGTPTLELSAPWTDDTTRADALALQDNVLVKSGATTRRYIGTFRSTDATTTEDSEDKRFFWNYYNQIQKVLRKVETTNSWVCSSGTFQQANTSTANQVEVVVGALANLTEIDVCMFAGNLAEGVYAGIGINSVTVNSADVTGPFGGGGYGQATASLRNPSRVGYSYYAWLQATNGGSQTIFGDNGDPTKFKSGMAGLHWC